MVRLSRQTLKGRAELFQGRGAKQLADGFDPAM
jgi:hypothetical protein